MIDDAAAAKIATAVWTRYTITDGGREVNLQDALERILARLNALEAGK